MKYVFGDEAEHFTQGEGVEGGFKGLEDGGDGEGYHGDHDFFGGFGVFVLVGHVC